MCNTHCLQLGRRDDEYKFGSQLAERDCRNQKVSRESALKDLTDGVDTFMKVVTTSKNLKITYVRSLNDVAQKMEKTIKTLDSLSDSKENRILKSGNESLKNQIALLSATVLELREDMKDGMPLDCREVHDNKKSYGQLPHQNKVERKDVRGRV